MFSSPSGNYVTDSSTKTQGLLSTQYAGKGFSIGSTNWSQSFSDLVQHMQVSLERVYVLKKWAEIKDLSLNKVTVADTVLEKSHDTLHQKNSVPVLTLSKEVSLKAGDKVIIVRNE